MSDNLEIKQSSEQLGPSHWKWAVWLSGEKGTLDRVKRVEYLLHSTFSPPTVQVTDRRSSFRLDGNGWGGFLIRAQVDMEDGSHRRLEHDLTLTDEEMQTASRMPSLAISYAAGDGPMANWLANNLIDKGVNVIAIDGGFSPPEDLQYMDGIVVMVPSRLAEWMEIGLSALAGTDILAFVLMSKDNPRVNQLTEYIATITQRTDIVFVEYKSRSDLNRVSGSIYQTLRSNG
jgi:hypothetical protein